MTLALVTHARAYGVSLVERAAPLVASHKVVPDALFTPIRARGHNVPKLDVCFIQSVNDTVDPLSITPDAPGTPACVSNCLIVKSPADWFFKSAVCSARLPASGPAALS